MATKTTKAVKPAATVKPAKPTKTAAPAVIETEPAPVEPEPAAPAEPGHSIVEDPDSHSRRCSICAAPEWQCLDGKPCIPPTQ